MGAGLKEALKIHSLFKQFYKIMGPLLNYCNPFCMSLRNFWVLMYCLLYRLEPILTPMGLVILFQPLESIVCSSQFSILSMLPKLVGLIDVILNMNGC